MTASKIWLVCWAAMACSLAAQDRRQYNSPGLVISSDLPAGLTLRLRYSADGKHLLAAGRDKVVRQWAVAPTGALDRESFKVLRWRTWREQRGQIYDFALASPPSNQIVLAGIGRYNQANFGVADRATSVVSEEPSLEGAGQSIVRVAISDDGRWTAAADNSDVGVDAASSGCKLFLKERNGASRLLGAVPSRIRALQFTARGLMSAHADGTVAEWSLQPAARQPTRRFKLPLPVNAAEIAADRIFAASSVPGGVRRLVVADAGGDSKSLADWEDELPIDVAVTADGATAAVVTWQPQAPYSAGQFTAIVFDVAQRRERSRAPLEERSVIALSPDGRRLAVVGESGAVAIFNTTDGRRVDESRARSGPIWQVGLVDSGQADNGQADDGQAIAFREQRAAEPQGVNEQGAGAWRAFDLRKRNWKAADPKTLLTASSGAPNWRLQADPAPERPFEWHVIRLATNTPYKLPWNDSRDGRRQSRFRETYGVPRCYCFLEKTASKPERLVVGHRFGMSLFELDPVTGPRYVRSYVGHDGTVVSLAALPGKEMLVSSSDDHTICGWSLADWPHEGELGASFRQRGAEVAVVDVAPGSPAWEAGLASGQAIRTLYYDGRPLPRVADGLPKLRNVEPGRELAFVMADGKQMLTTIKQRPLWRFYATRDGEWVLWRWRDYFYDCSNQGDDLIGWVISPQDDFTPEFVRAEQARLQYHRPDKVEELINRSIQQPQKAIIAELVPPRVEISLQGEPGSRICRVRLKSEAGDLVKEPLEVSLWINNYEFRRWLQPAADFRETVRIPEQAFRPGRNHLVAQAYSAFGVRGDSSEVTVDSAIEERPPRLFALCVGVNDYSKAGKLPGPRPNTRRRWPSLFFAREDAEAMYEAFQSQAGVAASGDVRCHLLAESDVTVNAIQASLAQVASHATPQDVFVLYMAGHGYAEERGPTSFDATSFTYVTPEFQYDRLAATSLKFIRRPGDGSGQDLFHLLSQIQARQLVLLDVCHSGGSAHVLRSLAPGNKIGPSVLVACDKDELAYEVEAKGHGVFTFALLEALGEEFSQADDNADQQLSAPELYGQTLRRVSRYVEENRARMGLKPEESQTPASIIFDHEFGFFRSPAPTP